VTESRDLRRSFIEIIRALVPAILIVSSFTAIAGPFPQSKSTPIPTIAPLFEGTRGIGVVRTFMFPVLHPSNPARYDVDPYVPRWSAAMPAESIKELRRAGFDFLRIAVDPGPLFDADPATLERRIREICDAVEQTLAAGMSALVDIHVNEAHSRWNFRAVSDGPDNPTFRRFVEVTRQLASALTKYDPRHVALELFNEPPPPCRGSNAISWPTVLRMIYSEVRPAAPNLTLFLSGACFAKIEGLLLVGAQQFDRNTVFVFHFYEPFVFTHQGFWGSRRYLPYVPRLVFPPEKAAMADVTKAIVGRIREATDIPENEKSKEISDVTDELRNYFTTPNWPEQIYRRLGEVAAWAQRNGVDNNRILLGEFGAIGDVWGKTGAASVDRANWLRMVRTSAERYGFRWSVWALTNTMGMIKGDVDGPLDAELLEALGLRAR
jgi:endoglucanase